MTEGTEETGTISEPGIPREARNWAMACHMISLTGLVTGIGFVIGPLILWLVKREDHPFIDEQGKESVNFQITMLLATLLSGILVLVLIGIPLLIIVGLLIIIFPIIAGIKAADGEHYRYPISIRFIS